MAFATSCLSVKRNGPDATTNWKNELMNDNPNVQERFRKSLENASPETRKLQRQWTNERLADDIDNAVKRIGPFATIKILREEIERLKGNVEQHTEPPRSHGGFTRKHCNGSGRARFGTINALRRAAENHFDPSQILTWRFADFLRSSRHFLDARLCRSSGSKVSVIQSLIWINMDDSYPTYVLIVGACLPPQMPPNHRKFAPMLRRLAQLVMRYCTVGAAAPPYSVHCYILSHMGGLPGA